jgi:5'-AMP-activated protein kinase catalytic alpha subunit
MYCNVFLSSTNSGVEIDDCMMIEDDDILFLSIKEDYIAPSTTSAETGGDSGKEKRPHEKVPPMIGGFKVLDLLGRGGFGEVRLGEHQLTGEKVALKFLRKADILSLGAAERTNIEIQCLTTLKHMNIIRLQQYMESAHHVVLVFELMEGGDLLKYLKNNAKPVTIGRTIVNKSFLNEDEARHIFYQVLSAVSYAHNQHICHRDLKLENILIKQSTTLALVKIADFGLSDFYRPGATMKSNCGTLSFLAPEVLRGTATAGTLANNTCSS